MQAGSFVVDLKGKITGYQQQIEKIKQALQKVGADSDIGKQLASKLQAVTKEVDAIGKKASQRISSEGQIARLTDQLNNVDNMFKTIGQTMQEVKFSDLDTGQFSKELKDLQQQINDLQSNLSGTVSTEFSNIINNLVTNGKSFKKVLDDFKIDPTSLNYDNFQQVFSAAIEQSKTRAQELRTELEQLQTAQKNYAAAAQELSNLSNFSTNDKIAQSFGGLTSQTDIFQKNAERFKEQINQYLSNFQLDPKVREDIDKQLADALDPNNLVQTEQRLLQFESFLAKTLNFGGKTALNKNISNALGVDGNIFKIENFKTPQTQQIDQFRQHVAEFLQTFNNLNYDDKKLPNFINEVVESFSKGNPAEAIQKVTAALEAWRLEQAKAAQGAQVNANDTAKQITSKQSQLKTQNTETRSLMGNLATLRGNVNKLNEQIKRQEQQIKQLQEQLKIKQNEQIGKVHQKGDQTIKNAEKALLANAQAAKQYSAELTKVQQRERLIGKIEGIVQRWFSIYAAVRMIGQAFNSIKTTLQELDKTITEIAIVTDMSQSDLWGQMGQYTQLAREFGASISGVYQVSQLYYQQGMLNI